MQRSNIESGPCDACPWLAKGQPDITPEVRQAAEAGKWFCCHTRMGTCEGATLVHKAALRSELMNLDRQIDNVMFRHGGSADNLRADRSRVAYALERMS